jgi:hypothetical protein
MGAEKRNLSDTKRDEWRELDEKQKKQKKRKMQIAK